MFSYYIKLGWLSIRRNPLLSALMIIAIAVGIVDIYRRAFICLMLVMMGN